MKICQMFDDGYFGLQQQGMNRPRHVVDIVNIHGIYSDQGCPFFHQKLGSFPG